MTTPPRFSGLYPAAPPVGDGPYHCQDCGASLGEEQADATLIADWCWCADCWQQFQEEIAHIESPDLDTP